MALNKEVLKTKLIQAFNKPGSKSNVDKVAEDIATAIHEYLSQADVIGACPSEGGALLNGKVV